jgi:hypothetical protein
MEIKRQSKELIEPLLQLKKTQSHEHDLDHMSSPDEYNHDITIQGIDDILN